MSNADRGPQESGPPAPEGAGRPPAHGRRPGSVSGTIRLILGLLVAAPSGLCVIGIPLFGGLGTARAEDYLALAGLVLAPFLAGCCLIWSGWSALRSGPSRRTATLTIVAVLLLLVGLATCSSQDFVR